MPLSSKKMTWCLYEALPLVSFPVRRLQIRFGLPSVCTEYVIPPTKFFLWTHRNSPILRLIPVDHEAHAPKVVWERSTAEPSTFHTQPSAVVAYDTDKYNLYGDVHTILKDISEIRFPSSTSESCKNIKMAGFMLGPCSRSIPSNFCDAYMHTKSQNKILKDCSEKQNALQGRSQDVFAGRWGNPFYVMLLCAYVHIDMQVSFTVLFVYR